jgi:hypothetical protein
MVALLAVSLLFVSCAGDGSLATGDRPVDPAVTVEKALPYIKTGATLAMGAGLKYGIDNDKDREAIANLSWSISHATWTLTDGKAPTVDQLKSYLLSFNYELDNDAADAYAAMADAIAALYGGYYTDLQGNSELAVKVLNAIAEGAAAGSQAYATIGK